MDCTALKKGLFTMNMCIKYEYKSHMIKNHMEWHSDICDVVLSLSWRLMRFWMFYVIDRICSVKDCSYFTYGCFMTTIVSGMHHRSAKTQHATEYREWKNKQSSLVKETISERLYAIIRKRMTQYTTKSQMACSIERL